MNLQLTHAHMNSAGGFAPAGCCGMLMTPCLSVISIHQATVSANGSTRPVQEASGQILHDQNGATTACAGVHFC